MYECIYFKIVRDQCEDSKNQLKAHFNAQYKSRLNNVILHQHVCTLQQG